MVDLATILFYPSTYLTLVYFGVEAWSFSLCAPPCIGFTLIRGVFQRVALPMVFELRLEVVYWIGINGFVGKVVPIIYTSHWKRHLPRLRSAVGLPYFEPVSPSSGFFDDFKHVILLYSLKSMQIYKSMHDFVYLKEISPLSFSVLSLSS